jgi:hypothetical protein
MKSTIITIRQQQQKLKLRVAKIFAKELPKNWIMLFIHDHPEYVGFNQYFSNVRAGRIIPNDALLNKLQTWVSKNRVVKTKKS